MIYREQKSKNVKSNAVKGVWASVIDSRDLGHVYIWAATDEYIQSQTLWH